VIYIITILLEIKFLYSRLEKRQIVTEATVKVAQWETHAKMGVHAKVGGVQSEITIQKQNVRQTVANG
jgi:hypothetical protein